MGKLCTELRHLGISVHKEVEHADDKRSDMLISYDGYNVPVEVKKSDSRDLWSAVQEQLIRKYTRDPNSNGYGILLVFWFGRNYCQNPDSGNFPIVPMNSETDCLMHSHQMKNVGFQSA